MTRALSQHARKRSQQRGVMAEYLACAWMMLKGYRFCAMRYKTPVGEIDLIMRKGGMLVFVEVKARSGHDAAAFAIHAANQQRVMRAAQHFIVHHPRVADYAVRFDAVLVAWYKMPRHVPHAFTA